MWGYPRRQFQVDVVNYHGWSRSPVLVGAEVHASDKETVLGKRMRACRLVASHPPTALAYSPAAPTVSISSLGGTGFFRYLKTLVPMFCRKSESKS